MRTSFPINHSCLRSLHVTVHCSILPFVRKGIEKIKPQAKLREIYRRLSIYSVSLVSVRGETVGQVTVRSFLNLFVLDRGTRIVRFPLSIIIK